ncbi:hypothetical protein [Aquimarina rhabdastrellae]
MRNCLLLLFFMWICIGKSQNRIYTQEEIDAFDMDPPRLTLPIIATYKKMLESNPKLKGWVRYYRKRGTYHLKDKGKEHIDSALFYFDKAINYYNNLKYKEPLEKRDLKGIYINPWCI